MYSVEYIKYVISIAFTAAYFVMANIRSMRFINSDVMSNREIESSTVYLTSTILPLSQPISYDLCTHAGNYKIMTTQHGDTHQGAETYENRWQDQNGTWFAPAGWKQTCGFTVYNNGNDKFLPMTPCVFDLSVDANETTNLAVSQPELLHELWLQLNISWLGYYHSRSPAALLGPCNMPCAGKKWSKMAGGWPSLAQFVQCPVAMRTLLLPQTAQTASSWQTLAFRTGCQTTPSESTLPRKLIAAVHATRMRTALLVRFTRLTNPTSVICTKLRPTRRPIPELQVA